MRIKHDEYLTAFASHLNLSIKKAEIELIEKMQLCDETDFLSSDFWGKEIIEVETNEEFLYSLFITMYPLARNEVWKSFRYITILNDYNCPDCGCELEFYNSGKPEDETPFEGKSDYYYCTNCKFIKYI